MFFYLVFQVRNPPHVCVHNYRGAVVEVVAVARRRRLQPWDDTNVRTSTDISQDNLDICPGTM